MALRPVTHVARTPTRQHLFGGAPPEEDTPASPPPGQGGGQTMSVPGLGDITEEEMKLAMEFRQKMAQKMQETRVEGLSLGGKVKVVYDGQGQPSSAVWKSKFYGAVVLNRRVGLHAIDATPARWRGDVGSSPLDGTSAATSSPRNDLVKNCRVHPTHFRFPHRSSVEVTDAALGEGADKVAQGVVDAAKQAQGEALVKMKAIMQDMQKDIAKTLQADMK